MWGGGLDLEWLEHLDAEGNRTNIPTEKRIVGNPVGPYAGLNVCDPQPGFEYQWMLNPSRPGANPADSLAIHVIGGVVVTSEDPEFAAFKKLEGMGAGALDTSTLYKELVLVKIPEEMQARRRQENLEKNARMLRKDPADSFVAGTSALESERYSGRGPTRFALRGHQTEFTHGLDTAEVSLPDSGIVKTENE